MPRRMGSLRPFDVEGGQPSLMELTLKSLWQAFWDDASGQGLVEYALIIALVAVGLIAILLVLRNKSVTCSTMLQLS